MYRRWSTRCTATPNGCEFKNSGFAYHVFWACKAVRYLTYAQKWWYGIAAIYLPPPCRYKLCSARKCLIYIDLKVCIFFGHFDQTLENQRFGGHGDKI
jgi:hypothetical protein